MSNQKRKSSARGCYELDASERASAVKTLNHILEGDPRNIAVLNTLGHIFRVAGEADQAKHCYARTLAIDPDCSVARFGLSEVQKENPAIQQGSQIRDYMPA